MDFKISDGIELQLRRIADALDRMAPPPLAIGARRRDPLSADDLQVTSDEALAKIEEEEARAKGVVDEGEFLF